MLVGVGKTSTDLMTTSVRSEVLHTKAKKDTVRKNWVFSTQKGGKLSFSFRSSLFGKKGKAC